MTTSSDRGMVMDISRWIAVDQGCTKLLMSAQWNGRYIDRKVPTGMQVTKEYVLQEVRKFIDDLPFRPEGIGCAIAGLVTDDEVIYSDTHGMEGLKGSDFFGLPCHLINDVKAATVEESSYLQRNENIVLIMAGSAFAMGYVENGNILLGSRGWAGELGSVVYPVDGKLMKLDDISGGMGILEQAGCTADELLERLRNHDREAENIIKQAGTYFGLALQAIVHNFTPRRIVIGGSTSTYPGYMEAARKVLDEYAMPILYKDTEITEPHDRKRVVALGARRYAFNREISR